MDLELGFITKGLTERSILSQSGGAETLEEMVLEDFPFNLINDFTQETLKAEQAHYDEKKVIPVKSVCSAFHGGPLDYPKTVSKAIGDVLTKWQICFEKVQIELEPERRKKNEEMEEDSANLGTLYFGISMNHTSFNLDSKLHTYIFLLIFLKTSSNHEQKIQTTMFMKN